MLIDPSKCISLVVKIGQYLSLRLDLCLLGCIYDASEDLVLVNLAIEKLSVYEVILVIEIVVHILEHMLSISGRLRSQHHNTSKTNFFCLIVH